MKRALHNWDGSEEDIAGQTKRVRNREPHYQYPQYQSEAYNYQYHEDYPPQFNTPSLHGSAYDVAPIYAGVQRSASGYHPQRNAETFMKTYSEYAVSTTVTTNNQQPYYPQGMNHEYPSSAFSNAMRVPDTQVHLQHLRDPNLAFPPASINQPSDTVVKHFMQGSLKNKLNADITLVQQPRILGLYAPRRKNIPFFISISFHDGCFDHAEPEEAGRKLRVYSPHYHIRAKMMPSISGSVQNEGLEVNHIIGGKLLHSSEKKIQSCPLASPSVPRGSNIANFMFDNIRPEKPETYYLAFSIWVLWHDVIYELETKFESEEFDVVDDTYSTAWVEGLNWRACKKLLISRGAKR